MNAITLAPGRTALRTSLEPTTLDEAMRFADRLAKSTMIPRDFQNRPENVLVAVQWGREIGLGPLQALQNIAVINGRPAIWGDAMLALVRGSGLCATISETTDGEGDKLVARCITQRRDDPAPVTVTFSVDDAKRAGLWGKAGPWTQYPRRMLQLRARGFCLRDAYPDVLRGVISAEEAQDIPDGKPEPKRDDFPGPTIDAQAEPQTRESINAEIPMPAPKRTLAQFLDGLEVELREAQGWDEVSAIANRPDVLRAQEVARNGLAERLAGMLEAARERHDHPVDGEVEA